MQWVTTTGRTIEEAKEAALDELGIDASEAEFEILEEPKTGLFGRVRADAKIRARVQPKTPRAKQERRPRKPKSDDGGSRGASSPKPATDESSDAPADEDQPARRPSTRRRSGETNKGAAAPAKQGGNQMTDDVVSVGTQADIVTEFLEGLLKAFDLEGTVVRTEIDEDTIELSVEGDDLGLLIGPKGQTLTAVHELSRTVLQRRATGRHDGRVRIDIGGYRARRAEALARFVTQQAEVVRSEGAARALEPMNAPDRKVVHDTVNGIDGVSTESEGVDPNRRVVLVPEAAEA
jgi:spoIIIJ-associated protein